MTNSKTNPLTYDARAHIHDDDGISTSPSRRSSLSSDCASPEQLIDELTDLGFDNAAAFVIQHGADRISQALARALSRPPGTIKNLPGYIRSLVTTRGPIPKPEKPRQPPKPVDRYLSGKYGHIVKH